MRNFSFILSFLTLFFVSKPVSLLAEENWKLSPAQIHSLDFIQEYLQFASVTGNEVAAGEFLISYFDKKGLYTRVLSDDSAHFNLAASIFPLDEKRPNIILMHHIDVVSSGNPEEWHHAPFDGHHDDEFIYGRGAIDAKGLGAMQIQGLLQFISRFANEELPYNVTILAVSGEETGGKLGAEWVSEHYFELLNPVLVLGEGGSGVIEDLPGKGRSKVFGISVAEKRPLWLELNFQSSNFGHGSTPTGNYTNKKMISTLHRLSHRKIHYRFNESTLLTFQELGDYLGGVTGFVLKRAHKKAYQKMIIKRVGDNPLFLSFITNTLTITNIQNPDGPPNQVQSHGRVYLDCRLLPGEDVDSFIDDIYKEINEPSVEISVVNKGPVNTISHPEAFFGYMRESIEQHHLDAKVFPIVFPASSDNDFFRRKGIPVYGITPVVFSEEEIKGIHNYNEKLSLEAYFDGITVFYNFLCKVQGFPLPLPNPLSLEK